MLGGSEIEHEDFTFLIYTVYVGMDGWVYASQIKENM